MHSDSELTCSCTKLSSLCCKTSGLRLPSLVKSFPPHSPHSCRSVPVWNWFPVYQIRVGSPGALREYEPFCVIRHVVLTACLSRVIKSLMITLQIGLGVAEMRSDTCSTVLHGTKLGAELPTAGGYVTKCKRSYSLCMSYKID